MTTFLQNPLTKSEMVVLSLLLHLQARWIKRMKVSDDTLQQERSF